MPKEKPIVLVLEDEAFLRDALIKTLERSGQYQVLSGENGRDGLAEVKAHASGFGFLKNKIDCILLDQQMPVMNGIQFATQLQQLGRSYAQIPVILCTSFGSAEDIQEAISSKCNLVATLAKPAPEKTLLELVSTIIQKGTGK